MIRRTLLGLVLIAAATMGVAGWGTPDQSGGVGNEVPMFRVDPSWPALPNHWVLGDVSQIAVDRRDHVWILHRPRSVPADQQGHAAPPVLELDAAGKFTQGWGGMSDQYEWPSTEHGIFVDYKDNVWIGGSNPTAQPILTPKSDDMLLKFTSKGKFILQIGHRDQSHGNKDPENFKRPTEVFVYAKTNEAFVSDGYGNRRVIVLNADTGAFKRMWGAFGNTPLDPTPAPSSATPRPADAATATQAPLDDGTPGPQQFGTVHGVKVSNDGLVYIEDRNNRRIQVFSLDGKYLTQVFINRGGPATMSAAAIAFSPDRQQEFMYIADYGNSHIIVLKRKTLEILDSFGSRGSSPGDFQGLHHIAADSKGNLYTSEVAPGHRAQKFVFTGISGTRH